MASIPSPDGMTTPVSSPPATSNTRPTPRGTAAYARKRAVTACQVCRARRTKCDNRKPSCSFCLKVGSRCIQSPVDLSSFDPASVKILEELAELRSAVAKCQSSLETLANSTTQPGTAVTDPSEHGACPDIDRSQLLPPSLKTISHWAILDLGLVPTCSAGIATPTKPSPESTISIDDLQPRLVRPLLDQFFQSVHVKNPVLDESRTRRLVAHFCAEGLDWSPESCLVLLVLALGATVTSFGEQDHATNDSMNLSNARLLQKAAQKRLGLTIDGLDRVLEAQCYFLSGVLAMTFFQGDAAWKLFLHALACCQHFTFPNSPDTTSSIRNGDEHSQRSLMEQTIYWSSWKSERELRGDMDCPDFTLSQAESAIYPEFFPTPPINDSTKDQHASDSVHDREQLSWYFYLSEISLRRLASCITNGILQFQESPGEHFLDGLAKITCIHESQAEEWAVRLPHLVSLTPHPPETDDICRFVLRGHLINLHEIIYWPFINALVTGFPMNSDHGQDRVLMRSLVRKGLQKHVERMWVNQPGYRHRHHGTMFLLRTCSRSALVLMTVALCIRGQLDRGVDLGIRMPVGWRQAVLLAMEMNCYWEGESVDSEYLLRLLSAAWGKVEALDV
ncbi:C6 zinc finger domain protein [Aspergillus californicus]